jgi:hypothetical protein
MGYSFEIMALQAKRMEARSELVSMTNLALRWLRSQLESGTLPRAEAIELDKSLTDFDLLSIFSSDVTETMETREGIKGITEGVQGSVQIFDLGYDPVNIEGPVADPVFFPPCFPGGYLIRARVAKKGLSPITMENVYLVTPSNAPGNGSGYVLKERPLYWRELFR